MNWPRFLCRYVPIDERLQLGLNDHVLDVGCGYGDVLCGLKGDGLLRVGLDLTKEKLRTKRLQRAGLKKRDVHWVIGDACALPFKPYSFDVVMSRQFVSHAWDLDKAIAEMQRACRRLLYTEDSNMLNLVVFLGLLFRFGPDWLWNKNKVLPDFGKMEDIHSMFWWKRKMGKIQVLSRRKFYNPMLDSTWRYFGPDCIWCLARYCNPIQHTARALHVVSR